MFSRFLRHLHSPSIFPVLPSPLPIYPTLPDTDPQNPEHLDGDDDIFSYATNSTAYLRESDAKMSSPSFSSSSSSSSSENKNATGKKKYNPLTARLQWYAALNNAEDLVTPGGIHQCLERAEKRPSLSGSEAHHTEYGNPHPFPHYYGIDGFTSPGFCIAETHADPSQGFCLSMAYLPKQATVEMRYLPQKAKFAPAVGLRRIQDDRGERFKEDSEAYLGRGEEKGRNACELVIEPSDPGAPEFDPRRMMYKRIHPICVAKIIAVVENRIPEMEFRNFDKEVRVAFWKMRENGFALFLAGNQMRLPGAPHIETTLTFEGEHVTQLHQFLINALIASFSRSEGGVKLPELRTRAQLRQSAMEKFGSCLFCKAKGHYESMCPIRERVHKCVYCSQEGHYEARCPRCKICSHCRQRGHGSQDCPLNVWFGAAN